jgi:ABC-2 type transport system permease protein
MPPLSVHIHAVASIAKHELLISNVRYPLRIVSRFFGPLVWVVPFLLFGKAILGGTDSQHLFELTGIAHMPTFILVGTIVTSVSFNMLWLMSFAIRLESFRGTFESVYACPIHRITFFMGKLVASTIWSSLYISGLIIMGVFVLDVQFVWSQLPSMLVIMLLLFFSMYGLGLVLAGVILVYKESHTIIHFIDGLFSLIVPMAYPLVVLPSSLQAISIALPMTNAVISARNVIILGQGITAQWEYLAVLFAYIALLIPIGYAFYNKMEYIAKKRGVLHKY